MARALTQTETAKMVNDQVRQSPETMWNEISALSDEELEGLRLHLAANNRISADLTAIVHLIQTRRSNG